MAVAEQEAAVVAVPEWNSASHSGPQHLCTAGKFPAMKLQRLRDHAL